MVYIGIFLLRIILLGGLYFTRSMATPSILTGITFGHLKIGHCLGVPLHLQTPCVDYPFQMLETNIF